MIIKSGTSAMAPRKFILFAVVWLLFGLNVVIAQNCWSSQMADFGDRKVQGREYKLWLEVDHIARMQDPERASQIPHVYRDIFADLHKRWYALDNWMVLPPRRDGYRESKTPEQWASVGMQPGYPNMFAQGISVMLFIGYPQPTQPLILQDLRSTDQEAVSRGVYVAAYMQESVLPGLFDELQRISFSDGPCSDEALRSLQSYAFNQRFVNYEESFTPSSKALGLVPLLVPRFQREPQRYVMALRSLLPYVPAPKDLLADLNSKDANLRLYALSALSESRDILPTVYIRKLTADRDPKVRGWSIILGFQKRRSDYSQLKPTLAKLLDDPEWEVRQSATLQFAARRDPICASALLKLLEEVYRSGKSGDFFQFALEADYIAHQKFGFVPGTQPGPLHNKTNDTALKRYGSWVRSREQ
jgi:hypothetical protein